MSFFQVPSNNFIHKTLVRSNISGKTLLKDMIEIRQNTQTCGRQTRYLLNNHFCAYTHIIEYITEVNIIFLT